MEKIVARLEIDVRNLMAVQTLKKVLNDMAVAIRKSPNAMYVALDFEEVEKQK